MTSRKQEITVTTGDFESMLAILKDRVKAIKPPPGEIPRLPGIEIYGESLTRRGRLGGDHIIYIDFNRRYDLATRIDIINQRWRREMKGFSAEEMRGNRYIQQRLKEKNEIIRQLKLNRKRAGILVADVKGHDESGSFIVGMLHQSFLLGCIYEILLNGSITTRLFDHINTRFFNSSSTGDFLTMIYGEIFQNGKFFFITAGHPKPIVFSRKRNRFMSIPDESIATLPPIGIMPTRDNTDRPLKSALLGYQRAFTTNTLKLMGSGDILMLYTDGLLEHQDNSGNMFYPGPLERFFSDHKHLSSMNIAVALKEAIAAFNPDLSDDITFVLIKKE